MSEVLETSLDALLDGRLSLYQPVRGHRVGTDAVLLLAAARGTPGPFIDVGAGVGAVGLGLAVLEPGMYGTLVESEAREAILAAENVGRNDCAARVAVRTADILDPQARRGLFAPLVVTNPPFLDAARSRGASVPARTRAHVIGPGGLAAWIEACLAITDAGGRLVVIHRADALATLLAAIGDGLGAIEVKPVHARVGAPATRLLLRGTKGSRAPLTVCPALVLHTADGPFTAEADALARGKTGLVW